MPTYVDRIDQNLNYFKLLKAARLTHFQKLLRISPSLDQRPVPGGGHCVFPSLMEPGGGWIEIG